MISFNGCVKTICKFIIVWLILMNKYEAHLQISDIICICVYIT